MYTLKKCEMQGERQRELLANGLHSDACKQVQLSQAGVSSQEHDPGYSCGYWGLNYLSHHVLPLRLCLSKKVKSETEMISKPTHSNVECKHPK